MKPLFRSLTLRSLGTLGTFLVAGAAGASAQQPADQPATISGRVTEENGRPLVAASVNIPELGLGATTRDDGRYTINIPAGRVQGQTVTVQARAINFRPRTEQITLTAGTLTRDFTLAPNPLQLGEIVVTGAGTVSEVEKLGTYRANIDSTLIQRSNESNIVNALAAKAPSAQVVSQSGDPGSSSFIQLRGLTTITAQDGQPLFVVDGVPVDNSITYDFFTALNSGTVESNRGIDINPNDIERVEVLNGAASGAIYGARAGQGVILINTKKGRPGATRYTLRSSLSLDQHTQLPDFQRKYGSGSGGAPPSCVPGGELNCRVGFAQAGSWGPLLAPGTRTFDHSDEMFQTGYISDNDLTISGGNDRTTFYLSGGYNYDRGIAVGPNQNFQRVSVRFNGTHQLLDNLKVGANVAYISSTGNFLFSRNSISGLLLGAWRTPPTFNNRPYLDPQTGLHRSFRFPNPGPGSETASRSYDNPFFVANENKATSDVGRTFGNITAEYAPFKWLRFNETLGLDYWADERLEAYALTASGSAPAGVGSVSRGYIRNRAIDNSLSATADYRVSPVFSGSVTLGQNLNSTTQRTEQALGVGLIAAQPFNLLNTSQPQPPYDFRTTTRLEGYFAQVTADLWNQLFLTAALRNDGASTFGRERRRAWFPKGSAAWTFYRGEGNTGDLGGVVSYGKLRAAYGESGTQPQPYLLQTTEITGTIFEGSWGPGLNSQQGGQGGLVTNFRAPNPDLGPERVREFEAGVDLGLVRDKADLSVTHYRQYSSDVILDLPVPASTGFTVQAKNAARLRNIGFEVALNVRPITRPNFSWEVGFQWARNRSKVTDLAGAQFVAFPQSGGTNGLFTGGVAVQGRPLPVFYGTDFVRCGRGLVINDINIDATAGHCLGARRGALYIDDTGYPQLDNSGQYVIGDPNPDWTGSIRTGFKIAKFSITGLMDIRHGGQAYNGTRGALQHFGTAKETLAREQGNFIFGQNYFQGNAVAGPGAGKAVPLDEAWFTGTGSVFNGPDSEWLEDGGFVKLREVSLGYTLDRPWVGRTLGFSSIELRVAGRNLVSWNNYSGVDPETSVLGSATAVRGVNYFNNPQTRSFVFSLTLTR